MRVYLVVPPILFARQAPISIAYLASYLKSRGHDVRARDLNTEVSVPNDSDDQFWEDYSHCSDFFERHKELFRQWVEEILSFDPAIVGLSVWDTTEYFVIKMAQMLKKNNKDILIVAGGFRCNLYNNDKLLSGGAIDIVVYGEGELTLADIVENYNKKELIQGCLIRNNGGIQNYGEREEVGNLDSLPFPDFSPFKLDRYLFKNNVPISFSRGCGWQCTYCVTGCAWKRLRVRSPENIYKEIALRLKEFPDMKGFQICDPSINQDINMVSRLCDLIIASGIKTEFHGYAQIKPQMNADLLRKLRRTGFLGLCYGIESGSGRILNKMRRPYTPELAERVVKDTYDAGIGVVLGFIVGFPGESEDDFQNTLSFIKKIKGKVTRVTSSCECWINNTYISRHPEEFGIVHDNGKRWESRDITDKTRKERKKRFNDFVTDMDISLNFPTEDRKYYSGKLNNLPENYEEIIGSGSKASFSFGWELHYACNYRCPYCWFDGRWHELSRQNRYPALDEVLRPWRDIHRRYGPAYIEIIGGEPFIYPRFTELIKELSQMHTVGITTNLSVDVEDFVRQVDVSRVKVTPTFHPLFADTDKFIERALLLKGHGMGDRVNYLAYPPQINLIKYYSDKFSRSGLCLSATAFCGRHNGRSYPQDYTKEERESMQLLPVESKDKSFNLGPRRLMGSVCQAGHKYAVVKADGSVFACGGSSPQVLGNLSDKDFKLLDRPSSCKSEFCSRDEWRPLLIEEKPAAAAAWAPRFPRKDPPYRVYWNWDIGYECNYKCSYCHFWKRKEEYPRIGIDKWKKVWDGIFEKYWCCHIRFSGGEPFVYPHFIELIGMLSEKHTVDVTTNLSFDLNSFLGKISPGGVTLSASFHPEFVGIDEFLDKSVFLNEKGFPTSIAFVAYPPYLKDLERYKSSVSEKRIFNKAQILFKVIPFIGEFEGKKYPENYAPEQKRLLEDAAANTEIDSQKELNVQWLDQGENEKSSPDKYCRMGQMYAKILPNGDVTRCCHTDCGKMGSILDEDFRLLDEPAPCKIQSCPCWKPMIVGYKEDKYPIFWEMPEHKIYKLDKTQPQHAR